MLRADHAAGAVCRRPTLCAMSSITRPKQAPTSHGAIDSFFQITARGSTPAREIRGGFATFFTMAYIVVLNPLIIGTQADSTGGFLGGGGVGLGADDQRVQDD